MQLRFPNSDTSWDTKILGYKKSTQTAVWVLVNSKANVWPMAYLG